MNSSSSIRNSFFSLLVLFFLLSGVAHATTFNVTVGAGGGRTFVPSAVTIAPGDTVLWTWEGNFHSVTSGTAPNPDGLFDSGVHTSGYTFPFTFPNAGSFPYFCTVHGAMMSGTINVVSATPTPSPAAVVQVGPNSDPFGFVPNTVSIQPGDTVEWDWFSDFHSVTSGIAPDPDGLFDSDVQDTGFVYFHTFSTPGSYPYFCLVHGQMMSGIINVGTASPTPGAVSISGQAGNCSAPPPTATPSGTPTPTLPPVPSVTMTLTGTSSGSTTTNGSGNYSFASLVPGGSYTVTSSKASLTPASAGINTTDVVAIQRHFLAITLIPPGCRLIAADANANGSVNTQDVVAVQRFFLGFSTGIASVGQYRFTPPSRSYMPLNTNQTGQDYAVLVLGDVAPPFTN